MGLAVDDTLNQWPLLGIYLDDGRIEIDQNLVENAIRCTGPGVHNRHTTHPILRPLLEAGLLCEDELHLGLRTGSIGRALDSSGHSSPTLLVAGTLRKSTLWESTAVPELRQQAQAIAQTALATLTNNHPA